MGRDLRVKKIINGVEIYCDEEEFFTENYIDDIELDEHDKEFDKWDIYDNKNKVSMKDRIKRGY